MPHQTPLSPDRPEPRDAHRAAPPNTTARTARIPGVPGFRARCGRQCSYVAALEAVLRYHGEDHDYVDLMGLGGLAFRLRWVRATWDDICGGRLHPGASASGCFGGHPDILAEVTGYAYEGLTLPGDGAEREAALLRSELAEGRPVLGLNAHGGSQWCVIAGYDPAVLGRVEDEDSPPGMLCRSCYDTGDEDYGVVPCFPWEIRAIRKTAEPPRHEEAVRASVRRAADLISGGATGKVRGGGGWFWHYESACALGLAAYDAWSEDLEDEAGIDAMPEAHFMTYWQSSAYLYDQLHDARRAALVYLRRIRPFVGAAAGGLLGEATGRMDDLVGLLTDGFPCFPFCEGGYRHPNGWYTTGAEREQVRGRQVPAHAPSWPTEVRSEAVALLRRARAREALVLEALQAIAAS